MITSARTRIAWSGGILAMGLLGAAPHAHGGGIPAGQLEEVVVSVQRAGLVGESISASEGVVPGEILEGRPILRPGEVLEVVPGLIVTQHSGDGKANQYFLRGFNLDHGTDFATRVDGVPVNMPTHGHGQGYTDISFLIPELIDRVSYRKGTYHPEQGNFSAAGSVDIAYRRHLADPLLSVSGGEGGYRRALLAGSPLVGEGALLFGLDYSTYDGPWELPQGFRKLNALAKYSRGNDLGGFSVTASSYDGRWRSTDQIPRRGVDAGLVPRFGFVDPTDRGDSHRHGLSIAGWSRGDSSSWSGLLYAVDYRLDLVSNFTYALDEANGDQFEQFDDRRVFGGRFDHERPLDWGGFAGELRAGLELRHDDIDPVGLYRTRAGERFATVREDAVEQTSWSAYAAQALQLTRRWRAELGARIDHFEFDVRSNLPANSGSADDTIVSPKLSMVFGPWRATEYFVNVGRGFHSNDARGTTIRVDPNDGVTPVERVDPLVRALGAEVGVRTAALPGLQLAASLWTLELDSELVFVGDGGTTEASRASRRTGIELGLVHAPLEWLIVDADFAWSRARFAGGDPAGDRIPGAVERVASLGVAVDHPSGWFGGARLRYFGDAPLVEDGSVRAGSTMLLNAEVGYRFSDSLSAMVTVFNLLDREDDDIAYYYESRLPGEPAPVGDVHFHPVEPRTVRATITWKL